MLDLGEVRQRGGKVVRAYAVRGVVDAAPEGVLFEASGGVNLESVRAIAGTGVDLISVGALTHSVKALDISLEITLAAPAPGKE